jgi:hypothetical protein
MTAICAFPSSACSCRTRPKAQRQPRGASRVMPGLSPPRLDCPRTARRRPACCRGAKAAGYHTGRAACAALPMPALRRPHDCDRGLRARLRAKVAADPKPDRHIMSQTACERRHVLAPMRWLHAGGDLSRHNHANQRADRPLIRSKRPPRRPSHSLARRCVQASRSRRPSVAPTTELGPNIKSP